MNKGTTKIGPLLACAIGDAMGAGFEYVPAAVVRKHNDLSAYRQHPKWKTISPGSYTDDTQMALALTEHMLCNDDWTFHNLATRFIEGFHRDQRTGYAEGFYKFLLETTTATDFLKNIQPHSSKSGGAMRAFPVGFLEDIVRVRDLAMFQASLTHATFGGMMAAAAAALMFHHRYHCIGPKEDLPLFLDHWVPNCKFDKPWVGAVGASGLSCTRAAVTAFVENDSLGDVLRACVAWTGDVDTVAAIAMPAAAVCEDTAGWLPQVLLDGLENGDYGRDYLIKMDDEILKMFPRATDREATLEAVRETKRAAKAAKVVFVDTVSPTLPEDDEPGVLAFLFDDEMT